VSQSAKKIPIFIVIACIALILISVYLEQNKKAKILGLRAKQINHGSSIFVDVPREIIDGHIIASMELKEQKIPYIIRRPMPNGGSEYWKLEDLELLNSY